MFNFRGRKPIAEDITELSLDSLEAIRADMLAQAWSERLVENCIYVLKHRGKTDGFQCLPHLTLRWENDVVKMAAYFDYHKKADPSDRFFGWLSGLEATYKNVQVVDLD